MGFFDYIKKVKDRLFGTPSPPAEEPYQDIYEYGSEEEDWEEEVVVSEEPPSSMEEGGGGCFVEYVPGRKQGRVQVFPRWRTVSPDADCIRDLFNSSGYRSAYTVIICGEPCSEYPGHEGEDIICLSYKFEGSFMRSIVQSPDFETSEDFGNLVNSEYPQPLVECWESVTEVAVLDH